MMAGLLRNLQLRIDPWTVDFGTGFAVSEDAEEVLNAKVHVDCSVERSESQWAPVSPEPGLSGAEITAFMDGVRRMEMRLIRERSSGFLFGGIGSLAAGAVILRHGRMNSMQNNLKLCEVRRLLLLPEMNGSNDFVDIPLLYPVGKHMTLEIIPVAGTDPSEPLSSLQSQMRKTEGLVAEQMSLLSDEVDLMIADGPLNLPLLQEPVIGYVKTLQALYVPAHLQPVLLRLRTGERTPLFLISPAVENEDSIRRYSCYLRIGESTGRYASLSGIVRLEVSASVDLEQTVAILNRCALHLPRFASPFGRDPRAPQNLMPLAALERELRRRLGNAGILRRILEDQF